MDARLPAVRGTGTAFLIHPTEKKDSTMSERKQHTAASMRDLMILRYGNEFHHKHNKNHHTYRQSARSHPTQPHVFLNGDRPLYEATGQVRQLNLRKVRKRLDKGRFH
jgi:hypothetical protein